jgi:enolase
MQNFPITEIRTTEIIDNRGMPTIRARVCVDDRFWGLADVPCGSSTGSFEACDVRDADARYRGKGVRKAIQNIHSEIFPALKGQDATCQRKIDLCMKDLDGTTNKSRLGGNAIVGVSLAVARAAAAACNLPLYQYLNNGGHVLPVPQACLINGGVHAGNDLDIQEFCIMPVGAESFSQAVRILSETFMALKDTLQDKLGKVATNSSEDGGFAPPISSSAQAMALLTEGVARAGYTEKIVYGLDFAATGFYHREPDVYRFEGRDRTRAEMISFIKNLLAEFPAIVSIEDPLQEDDLEGMRILTEELSDRLIIGDDTFATNIDRLRKGIAHGAANAMLCKVNQIGTVTEAMDAAHFAMRHRYPVVMSVRSGETEDAILSDISVALNAGLFKTGGIRGADRGANYNRFIEIEAELGKAAVYAGSDFTRLG